MWIIVLYRFGSYIKLEISVKYRERELIGMHGDANRGSIALKELSK
jgi:hypothetical protein